MASPAAPPSPTPPSKPAPPPASPATQRPPHSPATIAVCILATVIGLLMCVSAVTGMTREIREDDRMAAEMAELEDRSPAEVEAEKLIHETDMLEAEKARLEKDCVELEERLLALSARAPKMPYIETWVAVADGSKFIYLAAGTDERLEKGFQLSITRDKKFIARVVVQEVTDRACACRVLIVKDGERIKVGDDAATRLN